MSKKLARLQTDWTPKPRGRRRVRPNVRKAADRAMTAISIGLAITIIFLVALKAAMR